MNVIQIEWKERDESAGSAAINIGSILAREPNAARGAPKMNRCPNCRSVVYSRRSKYCGVCNEALPAEALFSPVEEQRIGRLLQLEKQRYRKWITKVFNQSLSVL